MLKSTDPFFIPTKAEKIYEAGQGTVLSECNKADDMHKAVLEAVAQYNTHLPKEIVAHVAALSCTHVKSLLVNIVSGPKTLRISPLMRSSYHLF
jgi:hypothetical protein